MLFFKFTANEDIFYPGFPRFPSGPKSSPFSHPHPGALIDRLPNEILGHIFTLCLSREHYRLPQVSEPPLLLCNVSSFWRKVAVSTLGWNRQVASQNRVPDQQALAQSGTRGD